MPSIRALRAAASMPRRPLADYLRWARVSTHKDDRRIESAIKVVAPRAYAAGEDVRRINSGFEMHSLSLAKCVRQPFLAHKAQIEF